MADVISPSHLNISASTFRMNSAEVRRAREAHWYAKTEWGIAVLAYKDSSVLLNSPLMTQGSAKWPAQHGVNDGQFHDWWRKNLLVLEGEEHHRIRKLVNPAFSRRRVEPLGASFRELAEDLVDMWVDSGRIDFARDFSAPYATKILCRLLGIDEADWPKIHDWASRIGLGLGVSIGENIQMIDEAIVDITDYAKTLIQARRRTRTSDILGVLVQTHDEDSGALSDVELVNIVILLIFAGIDTTRHQLSLAIDSFSRQPDQWDLLASNPEKYSAKAVEEALRVNPIGRWITREAAEEITHRDLTIAQGTTVHLFTLSSGTDPAEFANADFIDLEADRAPHFAFGGGVHHCLGHFVARTDIGVALSVLAERITNLHVGEDARWLPDSGNTGANALPLTFVRRIR